MAPQPTNPALPTRTATLIRGDGIGPEIADAVIEIFSAANVPLRFEEAEAGLACLEKHGVGLPDSTLESIRRNHVALKGPTTTPIGKGHRSVNVAIRKALGLYANVRPCRSLPGLHTRFENVDLVIVRENTEDTYGGIEHQLTPDAAQCLRLTTRPGSLAIARYAFDYARRENRKRITCVHKGNIHKITDGLFLDSFRQVAAGYPDIAADDILIDNCCMQLVTNPARFDVLLTPNLFGDIISDLGAGLVGGLGVAPGGNIGRGRAVFEAVHGSAPDIAGQGLANPTAFILSAVEMLRHLGLAEHASRIEQAVRLALVEGIRTRDLQGNASTKEFTHAVISRIPPAATPPPSGRGPGGGTPTPFSGTSNSPVSTTSTSPPWSLLGLDIFIRHDGIPPVPERLGPLRLALIANKGVKVGPGPAPDLPLVDLYCCRYLADSPITDEQATEALNKLPARFAWTQITKLHREGPRPLYSAAQGE